MAGYYPVNMANRKLQLSDADRKLRRQRQLQKVGYRCKTCGFTLWGQAGGEVICARCYRALLQRGCGRLMSLDGAYCPHCLREPLQGECVEVGKQIPLFSLDLLVPWVPMSEQPGKTSVKAGEGETKFEEWPLPMSLSVLVIGPADT